MKQYIVEVTTAIFRHDFNINNPGFTTYFLFYSIPLNGIVLIMATPLIFYHNDWFAIGRDNNEIDTFTINAAICTPVS